MQKTLLGLVCSVRHLGPTLRKACHLRSELCCVSSTVTKEGKRRLDKEHWLSSYYCYSQAIHQSQLVT